VIAQNLRTCRSTPAIDEADVGRIRAGQAATFTVDAFPGQTFEGDECARCARRRRPTPTWSPTSPWSAFSNPWGRLLPGMTANVRIVTETRENVLKVPNAALRVRIAGCRAGGARPGLGIRLPSGSGIDSTGDAGGWSWLASAHAQPAGGGGGFAAMRERLIADLQLDAGQQARLDAILAELRPKFMALRDLPEEERAAAREKVSAEMRSKITAMLTPTQRTKYQALQAQAASSGARPTASAAPGGPSIATKPIARSDQSAMGSAKKDAKNAPVAAASAAAGLIEADGLIKTYTMGDQTVHALRGVSLRHRPRAISSPSWAPRARASPPDEHPRLPGFAHRRAIYRLAGEEVESMAQ
jgi:HlyD family secretion protein